jgi:hypothetical protein
MDRSPHEEYKGERNVHEASAPEVGTEVLAAGGR